MIRFLYFILIIFNISAQTVFSQSDLSEKISLTMVVKEGVEGTHLICTLENKDSIGFWTEYFGYMGNKVLIIDSLGHRFNSDWIACGLDSNNYVYPYSSKTWEYNLTSFFVPVPTLPYTYIRRRNIPKGKYQAYWEVLYKPTNEKIRSKEIIYHNDPTGRE